MTQNLVGPFLFGKFFYLYKGESGDFDSVYVYVVEDDYRKGIYHNSLIKDYRRWSYSFNISKGKTHWVVIDDLPNDIMEKR
jgi:hypothetical protein